jgi:hypothetical protein
VFSARRGIESQRDAAPGSRHCQRASAPPVVLFLRKSSSESFEHDSRDPTWFRKGGVELSNGAGSWKGLGASGALPYVPGARFVVCAGLFATVTNSLYLKSFPT